MARQITGIVALPDSDTTAGTLTLTAKYNTAGATGLPIGASSTVAVAADGTYDDLIEVGTYYVTWTPTGGSSIDIGVAGIDAGPAIDIFSVIDSSQSPRSSTLGIAYGGTGGTTQAEAQAGLGLTIGSDVQAWHGTLDSIGVLGTASNRMLYSTGVGTWAETPVTAYTRTLLDDSSAANARTTLGVGIGTDVQAQSDTLTSLSALGGGANRYAYTTGINTWTEGNISLFGRSLIDDADAATAQATLGLEIGTDVQAYDATLQSLSSLGTAGQVAYTTAGDTWAETPISAFGRSLIDDADQATAQATLGVTIGTDVQAYDATLQSLSGLGGGADRIAYTTAIDTWAEATLTTYARGLLNDATSAAARATLEVVIGSDVQAYNANLQSLSGLGTAADKIAYTTAVGTWAEAPVSGYGLSILDDVDAAAARATLGVSIGSQVQAYDATLQSLSGLGGGADRIAYTTGVDTWAEATLTTYMRGMLNDADSATARATLEIVIGTDVQAYDDTLQQISTLGTVGDRYLYTSATSPLTWSEGTITSYVRTLLDDADAATAATTLGLGTADTVQFGQVGIGAPSTAKLSVHVDSAAAVDLQHWRNINGGQDLVLRNLTGDDWGLFTETGGGGVQVLKFDGATGYVGIGAASAYPLHIRGSGAKVAMVESSGASDALWRLKNLSGEYSLGVAGGADEFYLYDYTAAGRVFTVKGGNFGVGTTSPSAIGDIRGEFRVGNSTTNQVRVEAGLIRMQDNTDSGRSLELQATKISAGKNNTQARNASNTGLLNAASQSNADEIVRFRTNDNTGYLSMVQQSVSSFDLSVVQGGSIAFFVEDTGSVGVNTNTPSALFDVNEGNIRLTTSTSKYIYASDSGSVKAGWLLDAANERMVAYCGGQSNKIIVNTGQVLIPTSTVGIGTSSTESWGSAFRSAHVGGLGALWATAAQAASSGLFLSCNIYNDGVDNKRIINDEASRYYQLNGVHIWESDAAAAPDVGFTPTEHMRLDVIGNLGLGVTPEAWAGAWSALQIGGNSAITAETAAGAAKNLVILQNAYVDGVGWKRISQDEASRYYQTAGTHVFQTATSSSPDTAISWTDQLKVEADGTLNVGTFSSLSSPAETITGYITIKDIAGNTRKLAVIA